MIPVIEKVDDLLSVATYGNLLVFLFAGPVRAGHLADIGRLADARIEQHPGGLAFLSMSAGNNPAPAPAVRAAMLEFSRRLGARQLLSVSVVDDGGIFAATRRAFLRGLILVMGRTNVVIAGSLDEAIDRLVGVARDDEGQPIARSELERTLRRYEADLRLVRSDSAAQR